MYLINKVHPKDVMHKTQYKNDFEHFLSGIPIWKCINLHSSLQSLGILADPACEKRHFMFYKISFLFIYFWLLLGILIQNSFYDGLDLITDWFYDSLTIGYRNWVLSGYLIQHLSSYIVLVPRDDVLYPGADLRSVNPGEHTRELCVPTHTWALAEDSHQFPGGPLLSCY